MGKCKCKVCNKVYHYADENSPVLNEELWNRIVNHYALEDYSKKHSLYICSGCMESAIGRKLIGSDLADLSLPYNANYLIRAFVFSAEQIIDNWFWKELDGSKIRITKTNSLYDAIMTWRMMPLEHKMSIYEEECFPLIDDNK